MNWFYSFIVFQFTILLLHGRPETSTISTMTTASEHHHLSSVQSIVQNSENGPSSPSALPSAIVSAGSTKKPPSTTPLLTTRRVLSTVAQLKKVSPTRKAAKLSETTISASTAGSAQDSTAKTTRYYDKSNRTHTIMHANQMNITAKYQNNTSNNPQSLSSKNRTISKLRELRQQYVNGLNRQYLGNVYNVAPYLTQLMTTPKSIHTFLSSAPQQTYYIVHPDDIVNFNPQQSNLNLGNIGSLGNILGVGNPINTNLVSSLSASESYQLPRPPPLTVNIPYHEFPAQSSQSLPSLPPPLFHSANITKLYSIIGSSTPDPYNNFQEIQLNPSSFGQKIVKFSVTTHRPYKSNNQYGNGQNKRKPINNTNKNQDQFNQYNGNSNQIDNNQNDVNRISIVYNESSQFFQANKNQSNSNELSSQNKPKECLVTPNAGIGQTESVCNSNDLKITIKFDGSIANATEKNAVKSKPKKKKTVIMTRPVTPAPFYDTQSYESDEGSDESNELSGIFEPLQNVFGFMESSSSVERKPSSLERKPGHKDGEVVNKYQTVILQTPAPPKEKDHKSKFHKLFAILTMMSVLTPIGFALWTLVLSPILVITIGGVALGVVLYPFLAISKKQQMHHYSEERSPRIVLHKRPRPIYTKPINLMPIKIQKVIPKQPEHPEPLGPGHVIAKWTATERRNENHTFENPPKFTNNQRRRPQQQQQQPQRIIPIRLRKLHVRSKRRARDNEFKQWLLVQNNFNIRIMTPNHDYDY